MPILAQGIILNSAISTQRDSALEEASEDLGKLPLAQIKANKRNLKNINEKLNLLVDRIAYDSSLFAKAANFCNHLSWPNKMMIGAVLVVPLLIIALVTHIAVLVVTSLFLLATYTASLFLFHDYQKHKQHDTTQLKQELSVITTLFESILEWLDTLHDKLAIEIERFQKENEQLIQSVERLDKEVNLLSPQVAELATVKEKLSLTQNELDVTSQRLSLKIKEQAQLVEQYSLQLRDLTTEASLKQEQLSTQIAKLTQINESLSDDLTKAQQVADILQGTLSTVSHVAINDAKQCADFHRRLEDFLNNKELTLDHFAKSLLEIENKLWQTQVSLQTNTDDFEALLNKQKTQIIRLESVIKLKEYQALNDLSLFSNAIHAKSLKEEIASYLRNQLTANSYVL